MAMRQIRETLLPPANRRVDTDAVIPVPNPVRDKTWPRIYSFDDIRTEDQGRAWNAHLILLMNLKLWRRVCRDREGL